MSTRRFPPQRLWHRGRCGRHSVKRLVSKLSASTSRHPGRCGAKQGAASIASLLPPQRLWHRGRCGTGLSRPPRGRRSAASTSLASRALRLPRPRGVAGQPGPPQRLWHRGRCGRDIERAFGSSRSRLNVSGIAGLRPQPSGPSLSNSAASTSLASRALRQRVELQRKKNETPPQRLCIAALRPLTSSLRRAFNFRLNVLWHRGRCGSSATSS